MSSPVRNQLELGASRRLSRELTDLPVVQYFSRWPCCKCCQKCCKKDENEEEKKYDAYNPLSSDEKNPDEFPPSSHDKEAKDVLIAEQCLDQTVNKTVNNLSWVNATLLAVAMKNTMRIDFPNAASDAHAAANNAWIYFFAIFVIGIILAVTPRAFEDLEEMKRELELQQAEIKRLEQEFEEAKDSETDTKSKKIYNFIEVEGNDLVEKFEDLFVPTLSNTVSMAWRDAAKATFALIIITPSATATAYFFYALFMTTFGIYLVIRIGDVYSHKEIEIRAYLCDFDERFNTQNEQKKKLLKFAFRKRSIKLTQTVIKFAIAWSWRDCINSFIHAIYGTSHGSVVAQQWGYFITILLFVSVAFSFSDQFYILYPKNASEQEQQMFLRDKSRLIVNEVLYDNFRFVVGMALFDALMLSLESLSDTELSSSVLCFFYWVVAIGGICVSVIGTHYVKKWELRDKIAYFGVFQAIFDTFERIYDPECEYHKEGDADIVPMILDTTQFELVDVTVFGIGIAGSMGCTNAIKFTLNEITSSSGLYDITDPDSMQQHAWIIWLSFLICLAISTLITAYFARMVESAKEARRELFKGWKKEDEDGVAGSYSDDHIIEEDKSDKEVAAAATDQHIEIKKRKRASTKAEDYGGDIGGDHGGGGDDGGGGK